METLKKVFLFALTLALFSVFVVSFYLVPTARNSLEHSKNPPTPQFINIVDICRKLIK